MLSGLSLLGPNPTLASPLLADLHDLPKTLILSAEYDSLKNEEIKILIPLIAIIETTAGLK